MTDGRRVRHGGSAHDDDRSDEDRERIVNFLSDEAGDRYMEGLVGRIVFLCLKWWGMVLAGLIAASWPAWWPALIKLLRGNGTH